MIIIDPNTRQFNIPGAELVFGVESDAGSERKQFQAPRYVGDNLDLASCFVRMNFRNANGDMDSYLVDDVTVAGEKVTFSWVLSQKAVKYKGQVKFVVCAVGPNQKVEWHTTLGTGMVLEGLEPDAAVVEPGTADVVAQLIAMVEAQTAAVEAVGETWVGNVRSEGAAQVAAVKSASETAEAAAVAQIEAKGASTLATIPEDYTAVQSAVRGAANAIRGRASGEVIRVDDVSPMEHYPVVKVSGKNLFHSNTGFNGTLSGISYSMGENTSELTLSGTANMENALKLPDSFSLTKGTYCVSATGLNSVAGRLYLRNQTNGEVIINNVTASTPKQFTLTEDAVIRTYIVFKDQSTFDSTVLSIQIEKGDAVTEYTPYIDPTTVTVTRCGRNIIPYPFADKTVTRRGVTFTDNGDGTITLDGTADATTSFVLFNGEMPVNGKYTLSGLTGGSGSTLYLQPVCSDKAHGGLTDGSRSYEWSGITLNRLQLSIGEGTVFANRKVTPMLEVGETASAFEPYTAETQIPSSDGTVSGLSAVAPTMTLMTDTAGVNIESEYSRDTNAVIAEIMDKLAALTSGT